MRQEAVTLTLRELPPGRSKVRDPPHPRASAHPLHTCTLDPAALLARLGEVLGQFDQRGDLLSESFAATDTSLRQEASAHSSAQKAQRGSETASRKLHSAEARERERGLQRYLAVLASSAELMRRPEAHLFLGGAALATPPSATTQRSSSVGSSIGS